MANKSSAPATRGDIEDVLDVMRGFMDQVGREFRQVHNKLAEHDKRFDEQDKRIADIYGAIGELSAQVRSYHEEMIFLNHHVDKLTEAIKQIARETGIKLTVEL